MATASKKIYFFNAEKWEREYVKKKHKVSDYSFLRGKLTANNAAKYRDAQVISLFVHSKIDANILTKMPYLKLIATRSTGYDHIDLEACKHHGITVSNVPSYGDNTVAEHAFGLILALARKICLAYDKVQKLDFDIHGLRGWDLEGKTIGIVGGGNIGQHVARFAKGFGMKVQVFDIRKDPKLAKKIGFKYVSSLDALLKSSDVVSLHAPYNKQTHHLINRQNIKRIKKGAILINTARGGLVDTDALIWALDKKILSGAGLDVLEEECFVLEESELLSSQIQEECDIKTVLENHILIARDDVIVTPHNAFNSQEAVERILDTTVQNIASFKKGRAKNTIKA